MAYKKEWANKASHFDIVKNREVNEFLNDCDYITPPTEEEAKSLSNLFEEPMRRDDDKMPERIIAVDGSYHESSIDDRVPSSKIGYVKIGSFLIDMQSYNNLREYRDKYVDPFKVAKLQNNRSSVTFPLPSSNVVTKGKRTVCESFRYEVDKQLYNYRIDPNDPNTSLRTTLFNLASSRPGNTISSELKLHKCPSCGSKDLIVLDIADEQLCTSCHESVFPADCLRLWEDVTDYQSNQTALSRFMSYIEHILAMHYVRYLFETSLTALSNIAFFVDGPLAIFGTGAWLSNAIMRYLYNINLRLEQKGLPKLLIIGLQKTGQVTDYFNLINRHINKNGLFVVDDDYRYKYVIPGRNESSSVFGYETYYGQDFVYKTPSGRLFIFALPYPAKSKNEPDIQTFMKEKTKIENYSELSRAISLIDEFECDLYENAIVPIALAHRYTAISLEPGSRILDLLTREKLRSPSDK